MVPCGFDLIFPIWWNLLTDECNHKQPGSRSSCKECADRNQQQISGGTLRSTSNKFHVCFYFISNLTHRKLQGCKIALGKTAVAGVYSRNVFEDVCVGVCACPSVFVCALYVSVFHSSLYYFVASLAGLPGGCDTHSSASSHMKALDPLSLPLRSQGAHQRRGEGRERGERRRDGEWREGATGPLLQESHGDFLSIHL